MQLRFNLRFCCAGGITMNITIVGAGNVGTQIATHCAEIGHRVTIYGSKPERISKSLTVVNENDEVIHQGTIDKATSDTAEAFSNGVTK